MKNYVKMNENKNYLSLGNMFNIIKKISVSPRSAMQSEIFCSLFNISEINNTTVNNYCIGYRAIGIEYKNIFASLKEEYENNKYVFIDAVYSLMNIMDEKIYKEKSISLINKNKNIKILCEELYKISKNDEHVSSKFRNKINTYMKDKNYYDAIVELILYTVLENIQPIYVQNIKVSINKRELEEYLSVKLYQGISYITSLQELSKKNNMYANAELGSLEYSGLVSGEVDYKKSYEYYLRATSKNHPKAFLMVAYLILEGKVGNIEDDFNIAWQYLKRAVNLGSAAAYNTMGNCYLKGLTPDKKKDIENAKKYFLESGELGYAYAYNNLGIICETEGNKEEALKYYKISADLGESWALNKVGEHYRKKGDKKTAYIYYLKSSEAPISERNYYSFYNLAVYYYLRNIKTKKKGIEYLKIASDNGVKKATNLLKKYM